MRLEAGRVAVVTGGASGLGFALAAAFGRRGLKIVVADIEEAALRDAAARLRESGGEIEAVVADVSDRASVAGLRSAAAARFGAVDLLVNNAGVGGVLGPIWELHPNDWR